MYYIYCVFCYREPETYNAADHSAGVWCPKCGIGVRGLATERAHVMRWNKVMRGLLGDIKVKAQIKSAQARILARKAKRAKRR